MFTVLGFLAQVCVICVSIALFVDMHSVVSAEHDALVSAASLPQSSIVDDVNESDATLTIASSCAKFMTSPAITTTVYSSINSSEYNAMTVKQLYSFCRSNGIKGYSGLRKPELVRLVEECYLPW